MRCTGLRRSSWILPGWCRGGAGNYHPRSFSLATGLGSRWRAVIVQSAPSRRHAWSTRSKTILSTAFGAGAQSANAAALRAVAAVCHPVLLLRSPRLPRLGPQPPAPLTSSQLPPQLSLGSAFRLGANRVPSGHVIVPQPGTGIRFRCWFQPWLYSTGLCRRCVFTSPQNTANACK